MAFVAQRSNDDPYEFLLYEQYEREQAFRAPTCGGGTGARCDDEGRRQHRK